MPRIPDSFLAALKAAVPIPRLLESRGIPGRREGADWVCACPIPSHADQTPSFHVTELDGASVGHCFGCGWSGNVLQIVQRLDSCDFAEAVATVAAVGGVAFDPAEYQPATRSALRPAAAAGASRPAAPAEACPLDPAARGAALEDQVLAFAHAELIRPGSAGQVYLQGRGVWDPATAARFRLGFLPAGKLGRLLRDHRLDNQRAAGRELRAELTRLGWWSETTGHATMDGRVVVPIPFLAAGPAAGAASAGDAGRPAACGSVATVYGRAVNKLGHGAPNHKNLVGRSVAGCWNADGWVDGNGAAILAEAPIDALSLYVAGIRNVSCTLGVSNWTSDHLAALRASGGRDVFLAFDNDAAGNAAVPDVADALIEAGLSVYRVLLPAGQDLNEWSTSAGADAPAVLAQAIRDSLWLGGVPRVTVPALPAPADAAAAIPRNVGPAAAAPAAADTSFLAAEPPPSQPPAAPAPVAALPAAAPVPAPPAPASAPPPAPPAPAAPAARRPGLHLEVQGPDLFATIDGTRAYRVRGLSERAQVTMKIALRLLLPQAGDDATEPTRWSGRSSLSTQVDLTLASSRDKFATEAAGLTGLAATVIGRDLGMLLDACERQQLERGRAADAAAAAAKLPGSAAAAGGRRPPAPPLTAEQRTLGMALLTDPNLLHLILVHLTACGLVGETVNKLGCYLAATSRLLARPLAVLIQSSSAAGKTTLMDAILDLMPEEARKRASAISEMALYYEKDGLSHTILAIAEDEGASSASYSLKLLQSDGSLTFSRPVKDAETGELVTRTHQVDGPVQLMVTTTKPLPDDEWANRCLVLTVGEHAEQTAAIHERQRARQDWDGQAAALARAALIAQHHAAQRLLQPLIVINPYARQLRFTTRHVRSRRDHQKYLDLIAAITLLHQEQRRRETRVIAGQTITAVIVDLADIAVANALADVLLGQSVAELSAPAQGFLAQLDELVSAWAGVDACARGARAFTRSELHAATGRSHTCLKRFLSELLDQEWLTVERAGPNHPERYRVQFAHGAPAQARVCLGLTPVSELDPTFTYDLSWLGL